MDLERSVQWVIRKFVADVVGSSPAKVLKNGRTSIGQDDEAKSQLNFEIN